MFFLHQEGHLATPALATVPYVWVSPCMNMWNLVLLVWG